LPIHSAQSHQSVTPTPFLKWAGGKNQLLNEFERRLPPNFGTYFEPFLGGGAVFLHLFCKSRITRAVISDSNLDLMNCYVAIRDGLDMLVDHLSELEKHAKDQKYFYEARKRFNEIKLETGLDCNIEKAALMIYLNKTCYNGLYRVNRKGQFNVPWGGYRNPRICNEGNLRLVHRALAQPSIQILCTDFHDVTKNVCANDFVYFDPPYQPVSPTSSFTSYTPRSFTLHDQLRLAKLFAELTARGCFLMLSNSPRVEYLYSKPEYHVTRVRAARAISSIGSKRGPVDELLITNY
jgi:DNA adenine methylase